HDNNLEVTHEPASRFPEGDPLVADGPAQILDLRVRPFFTVFLDGDGFPGSFQCLQLGSSDHRVQETPETSIDVKGIGNLPVAISFAPYVSFPVDRNLVRLAFGRGKLDNDASLPCSRRVALHASADLWKEGFEHCDRLRIDGNCKRRVYPSAFFIHQDRYL